jgi:HAD superfamily hydrolase (TIGR01509 family)
MADTHHQDAEHPGILFDLDGVLWDTSSVHDRAFREVCRDAGLVPVPYDLLAGRPTTSAWEVVLAANSQEADEDRLAALTRDKQDLTRVWLRTDPPLSPEVGAVGALARSNAAVGLVTGASAASASIFLQASGLTFDVVITGESVRPGKPAPDPYVAAAAGLGLEPADCWVLEDSAQGIESAVAAGCRTVHLTAAGDTCPGDHSPVVACVASIDAFIRVTGVVVPA